MKQLPLLLRVLRAPGHMTQLPLADWELLLRQAAAANLVASLYCLAEQEQLMARIPDAPRRHLEWAGAMAARHRQAVRFEVRQIRAALARAGVPLILLKGAAYVAAGLPAAAGRLFSDVDILVPKVRLAEVESALMLHGWGNTHHDAYDQRYYRDWMHELPPMEHVRRRTVIDVHHAILPETAGARPDPASLRASAVAVEDDPGVAVLAPADMVLHSAVHLFSDGEFHHGLRDLLDIHRLLVHFGRTPGFWDALAPRARALELERPLFYALRYCARLFGTPVPAATFAAAAPGQPNRLLLALMDQLFGRALLPAHPSCADGFSAAAAAVLYMRGNWLRMPPLLLTRHLFHKALLSPRGRPGLTRRA
jgi:hypothetical protein